MGAWLQINYGSALKTFENPDEVNENGLIPLGMMSLQKKLYFFAMGRCFFLTRAF
jgi:hypothetical protein